MAMASAIMADAAELTPKENTIVDIGAWTARGEQDKLGAAFKAGFGAGLTLNEAKELVGKEFAEVVGDAAKILPPKAFAGSSIKSAIKALVAFVTERIAVK
jgi:hypothetical protein